MKRKPAVLVVCMGNICRSPTGEAVLKAKAQGLGLDIEIDSAGTIGYHQGNPPDPRADLRVKSAVIRSQECGRAKCGTAILSSLI